MIPDISDRLFIFRYLKERNRKKTGMKNGSGKGIQIPILIIDDNEADCELLRLAFEESNLTNPVYSACDGEEALKFLYNETPFEDKRNAPRPGIILLDINMPKINGTEVLRELKQDKDLERIPVIMLTTSNNRNDIKTCYELGANGYLVKPRDFKEFELTIEQFKQYWLSELENIVSQ